MKNLSIYSKQVEVTKKGYLLFIILLLRITHLDVKMYNLKSGLLKWSLD